MVVRINFRMASTSGEKHVRACVSPVRPMPIVWDFSEGNPYFANASTGNYGGAALNWVADVSQTFSGQHSKIGHKYSNQRCRRRTSFTYSHSAGRMVY